METTASLDQVTPVVERQGSAEFMRPWYTRFLRWNKFSQKEALACEDGLMNMVPVPVRAVTTAVGAGKNEYMRAYEVGHPDAPPLVCVPGYSAGAGFFFRNMAGLAQHFRTYCVDFLGTGMSGRPRYAAKSREESEAFFLDSLDAWRKEQGLDKMVLLGHSLGGYLSAKYALKHPEHVEHLILVCPAGIPPAPEDIKEPKWIKDAPTFSVRRMMFNVFCKLWTSGATPGGVVRTLGPIGESMTHRYAKGRFQRHGVTMTDQESHAFAKYFYQIMAAPGSGEHALQHLLQLGAWAHDPLEHTLPEQLQVPITFIYGEHDWMDPEAASRVCSNLRTKHRGPRVSGDQQVHIIKNAGHFPFVDSPSDFLDSVIAAVGTRVLKNHTAPIPRPLMYEPVASMAARISMDKQRAVMEADANSDDSGEKISTQMAAEVVA